MLLRSDLLGTLECSVPFLALNISINGFFEVANSFIDFSSGVILVDLKHSWTQNENNILNTILSVAHREIEASVPYLLKMVRLEHVLGDFQVSINCLVVVS